MSLRVWLPLNGDLRNNGLDSADVLITSAQGNIVDNGKIGKCFKTTSTGNISLNNSSKIINTGDMSFGGWFKFNKSEIQTALEVKTYTSSATTATGSLIGNNNYGGFGLIWQSNNMYSSNKVLSSINIFANIRTSTASKSTSNFTIDFDVWTHIFVTFEKATSKLSLYKNGVLYSNTILAEFSDCVDRNICINYKGIAGGNGPSASIPFYTNDVRLYDHALSIKEVKELSKGLVCHYKLDNGSFGGQDNIYNFQSVASKWTADGATRENYTDSVYGNVVKVISSSGNKRIYRNVSNVWTQGQKYAVSFLAKADSSCVCDMSRSLINFSQQFTLTTEWKRYSGVIDCTATVTDGTLSFRVVTTGVNAYITQIKLEYGEVATTYRPNINDPDYNKLGYNSTIIYDSSGYNHHGTRITNTISCSTDTAKNSLSTNFNGTDDGIIIQNLDLSPIINNSATYSFWIKPNGENGARSVYFGMWTGTSWSIEKTTNNLLRSYWAGSPDEICSGATITDGQWQHICVVKNGANSIKAYINGVLKWTSTTTHSNLNFATTCRIGRDTRSGDGTPYKGLMSDFRIYATALSAEDIKELYQTSASIDKDGNVFAYEYKEV